MRRGIVGSVTLITLGVLFLLDEWTRVGFHRTWPILLIAIGVAIVVQRMQPELPPAPPAPGPETSSTDKVTHG
jgi:hypothetical protein